jgi:hypothetical protein
MNSSSARKTDPILSANEGRHFAEIIHDIGHVSVELINAEAQLLRTEMMQKLTGEIIFTRRLMIGSGLSVLGSCMVLVAIVFAMAPIVPPWIMALGLGLILIGSGIFISFLAWRRHKTLEQIKTELEAEIAEMLDLKHTN